MNINVKIKKKLCRKGTQQQQTETEYVFKGTKKSTLTI